MIVYDLQNAPHEMTSVDARECVEEMGWSYSPQPTVTAQPVDEPARRGRPAKAD